MTEDISTSGHNPRRIKRPYVIADPMGQCFLADLTRSKAKDNRCRLFRRCIKIDAIKPKKYDHRGERRPFVAVDESVIARNAKSIRGGKAARSDLP